VRLDPREKQVPRPSASLTNFIFSVGGHGTFDYINLDAKDPSVDNPGTDVLWQARQLQLLFVNNPDRTDTKDNVDQRVTPSRNSESFAGCGTGESYSRPSGLELWSTQQVLYILNGWIC